MRRLLFVLSMLALATASASASAGSLTLLGVGAAPAAGGGGIIYDAANSGAVSIGTIATGSSATVTLPHAIPAGDAACLYIGGSAQGNLGSGLSVTDTPGNTYTLLDAPWSSGAAFGLTSFYAVNISGSPTSVVVHNNTGSTTDFAYLILDLFSGVATSSALDAHAGQAQTNPGTTADKISSGAFSPAASGDLICGAMVDSASHGTASHGTGFTAGQSAVDGGTYWTEYKLSGASGSQAVTFTDGTNGGADVYATAGMALR